MRPAIYTCTLLVLLALSFLTFGLSFVSLGAWSLPVAMLIAGSKAALVACFFMHLWEHGTSDRAALVLGVLLVLLLVGFVAVDVATRVHVS